MILPLPGAKVFPCSVLQSGAVHLSLVTLVWTLTNSPQCRLLVWDGRAFHTLWIVSPPHVSQPSYLTTRTEAFRYKLAPPNPAILRTSSLIQQPYTVHTSKPTSHHGSFNRSFTKIHTCTILNENCNEWVTHVRWPEGNVTRTSTYVAPIMSMRNVDYTLPSSA